MRDFPFRVVRLTVPISGQLSENLSVLAWQSDLTRQQYVRRALEAYMADHVAKWAALSGVSAEAWLADAKHGYQIACRVGLAGDDSTPADPGPAVVTKGG